MDTIKKRKTPIRRGRPPKGNEPNVVPFIPNRMRDGYDLGPAGLAAARTAGAGLILTCDCGTTARTTISEARAAGVRVVVTDHHVPGELPAADAIVNPRRGDAEAPWADLCGTGVAFKLVQALVPALGLPEHLPLHVLDLVALATVADVVPLTGENRVLVRYGLRKLQETRWAGLRALVEVAGLGDKPVRAGHVAFVLGPRLNAAGRIGEAMDGLALLLSDDPADALDRARRLDTQNAQRQELDQRILQEAIDVIERDVNLDDQYGLVLASDTWHPGVRVFAFVTSWLRVRPAFREFRLFLRLGAFARKLTCLFENMTHS